MRRYLREDAIPDGQGRGALLLGCSLAEFASGDGPGSRESVVEGLLSLHLSGGGGDIKRKLPRLKGLTVGPNAIPWGESEVRGWKEIGLYATARPLFAEWGPVGIGLLEHSPTEYVRWLLDQGEGEVGDEYALASTVLLHGLFMDQYTDFPGMLPPAGHGLLGRLRGTCERASTCDSCTNDEFWTAYGEGLEKGDAGAAGLRRQLEESRRLGRTDWTRFDDLALWSLREGIEGRPWKEENGRVARLLRIARSLLDY
jgi:hypothetical protein